MSNAKSAVLHSPIATRSAALERRSTVLLVQWALALACTYMVLFSEQSRGIAGWGNLVVLAFLVMNFAIGRLDEAVTQGRAFMAAVGLIDAVLIVASLQFAGQLSVELVLLCLGIVILAVSGLSLGTTALASIAMILVYLLIVASAGDESPWHFGTLLRLPFLFTAAVAYAWFVELGSAPPGDASKSVREGLATQMQAIERCRQALSSGATSDAESALAEIERETRALEREVARA
jgi:hypothetical protein